MSYVTWLWWMAGPHHKRAMTAAATPPAQAKATSMHPSSGSSSWLYLFIVVVLSFLLNANTLTAAFTYDDARGVVSNPDLKHDTPMWNIVRDDFWGYVPACAGC